ncbi:bleomycin resistance protein [Fluviicola chungangensis]|uniref:Bleomycin resistance protein n=1 Tax=Fluviicola chungangensis TaxID=2597671 RepID=A0A556N2K6_9FLAO|nr:VOC family protein [Fluviicola chungangensis]TSJ46382.1 VOC family protein [Fluviicola chungangensis]
MLTSIHPKLPMRSKQTTREFYQKLGFQEFGNVDFPDYLIMEKGGIEIHFFLFKELDPKENYGQVYIRSNDIDLDYLKLSERHTAAIHPNGHLEDKPWGQREFSILDPDNNLLTFGQTG